MFENKITLTDENHKKTFSFDYSFSNINIKKVDVISLHGKKPEEWHHELTKLTLLFTYTDKENRIVSFPLSLIAQIQVDQWNPIIKFNDFIIPEENKNKMTSLGNYVVELSVELKIQNADTDPVTIDIYYQATPGVKIKE